MIISMSMFWPPPPRPFQLPASRGRRGDPAIADRGRGINQRASLGNGFTLVWLARLGRALLIRLPALLLRAAFPPSKWRTCAWRSFGGASDFRKGVRARSSNRLTVDTSRSSSRSSALVAKVGRDACRRTNGVHVRALPIAGGMHEQCLQVAGPRLESAR